VKKRLRLKKVINLRRIKDISLTEVIWIQKILLAGVLQIQIAQVVIKALINPNDSINTYSNR